MRAGLARFGQEKQHSKVISEMRQHLIKMNREKMMERGGLTDKEAVLLGKYSSLTGLATMELSTETVDTSDSNFSDSSASRLWRELLY